MSAALAEGLVCPHCGERLFRWDPPDDCAWNGEQRVCVNDACPYYVEGWTWMESHYGVHASYRYRLDPVSGHAGPLPVNSPTALEGAVRPIEEDPS
jgi:hypothetical protein